MSERDDGGPAFPVDEIPGVSQGWSGMTLRDYFAAKVLAAEIASPSEVFDDMNGIEMTAYAYGMADLMISQRAK